MTVKLVKLYKGKIINNKKGDISKYVSVKSSFFKKFGEVYFNEIVPYSSKGWIKHKTNTCLITCLSGKVKFHLIDERGKELKIFLNSKDKNILKIPPKIWFCFRSYKKKSIIVNLIDKVHSNFEVVKKDKVKKYLIN